MVDTNVYSLSQPTLAQGCGVTLALFGLLAVYRGNWSLLRRIGVVVSFLIAYGTFFAGLCLFACRKNPTPVDIGTYVTVILAYLCADAFLLPIMVGCSGGVKQSLFTPLFFSIPAMAVVFVPHSGVWDISVWGYTLEVWSIFIITVLTLSGYTIIYYWFSTDDDPTVSRSYRFCEWFILCCSVALTVWMSLWVNPLP